MDFLVWDKLSTHKWFFIFFLKEEDEKRGDKKPVFVRNDALVRWDFDAYGWGEDCENQ